MSQTVKEVLITKHPAAQKLYEESILTGEPEDPHPIIFEAISPD